MACRIEPLQDARWDRFVDAHPRSSVFHSTPWLEALRRTYGYRSVAYTTSPPGNDLRDGVVTCRVASWITGQRLVSLPFSDHCEPLAEGAADAQTLVSEAAETVRRDNAGYLEVRAAQPLAGAAGLYPSTRSYCFHQVDLRPDLAALFAAFQKSSTQRKIQRAEREGLLYRSGRSPELLDAFQTVFLMTRRRHGVPPQPVAWFRNLIDCFGEALQIRVAFQDERPVAAILTLRHKDTLVYKYGGSDPRFSNLGGTHLLFWRSIEEAKAEGLRRFDLGRTDWDNTGLITFKDRWGAAQSNLVYTRLSVSPPSIHAGEGWAGRFARSAISRLPGGLFSLAGSRLYRHIG